MTNVFHPSDEPTDDELRQSMRALRNRRLAASDWTQLPDNGLSVEQREAWATYRQQLRDAPATWTPGPTWDAPEPPA